ncbi:hypothetical protein K440DRAFT_663489 [Wilcoxina mikolae CBS 423.85]|nr:hypothetical protein K440DRAFT_663489 [Wilcoxina mikolae CBS 423.85]
MSSSIKFLKKLTKRGTKSSDQLRFPSPSPSSIIVESEVSKAGSFKDESPTSSGTAIVCEVVSPAVHTTTIQEPNVLPDVPAPTSSVPPEPDRPKSRLEQAHSELLTASASLATTLSDYFSGSSDSDVPPSDFPISFSSPETFTAAVERILLKQQNQPPTIASRVGSVISKIYPLASLTLGLAASATESAALTPVKGAVNSLALLFTLADQESARGEDFLKQLERIQYQSLRVAEVHKCAEVEVGELLREKSTNLMTSVIRFFDSSIIFFKHDYFYNLGKTVLLGPKIYSDARAELDLAIAEYDQALLLQVTIKVLAMRPAPPVDQKFQQSTLAAWLKSSFWSVDAQFSNNCELRAPGTLQWVLEESEFTSWRLGESKSLWLNGLPGVGKSIITAYLIQVLKAQHPDSVVLYFFCKAGDSTLDNVDRVIRTLAMQLALVAPEAREKLQMLMEEGFQCENDDAYAFSRLVKDTLAVVSRQVFVVIDGLDECFGGAAGAISTLLDVLQKLPVKLLVSSRPTPEISQAMGWGPKRALTFEDSRDDIKLYITMRVTKSKALQKGFFRLQKDPADFLSEKSQGNFLWVSIVLNLLERTPSAKAFQKAIETLPKGIVGVYEKVVDKLVAAETWEMAEAILVCVLFGARPMTMSELTVAVGLLVDEVLDLEQFVESNCGSFLGVVPGKDGPSVHIVHETFRAYITDPAVSKERCVPPGKSHMRLAAACLECLIGSEDEDLADLRRYSTRHWFRHFGDAWGIERDTVVLRIMLRKIHAFTNDDKAVRKWMREFTFLMEREHWFWNIGCFMSDVHYGIFDWLKSDVMQIISENSDDEDDAEEDLHAALAWRMKVINSDSFLAHSIVTNITFVWLNTNWKEVLMSRIAFTQALATAHILQLVEPFTYTPQTPLYGNRYVPKVPDHAKTKPGWTWRYAPSFSNHWENLTLEHIDSLASLGGYNPAIGLQSGNYAFAAWVLRSDACIKPFQRAIDEHPDCWHFHEALGGWHCFSGEKEKAVVCYGEAMKCDPKTPAGCAIEYWSLVSELKKSGGDITGAVEAMRTGMGLVPEKDAEAYWDRIVRIYEESQDWEKVDTVLREAIVKNPTACNGYWRKLADNYDRTFDWQRKMETYFDAMKRDPENSATYAQDLRSMAKDFKHYQLFEPAEVILRNGIERHKEEGDMYRKEMAGCYMAARRWKDAAELYEGIRAGPNAHDWEFKWLNDDLGNAYLGMGETTRALAAYQEKRMEKLAAGDVSGNSDDAAYVHMILGEFTVAIQQIKADITANIKHYPDGPDNWYKASEFMHAHRNLGVCYEALGRMEDAQASFKSAVEVFEKFITELEPFVHTDNKTSYYRSEGRTLLEFGLMLEKIGRREGARRIYEGAAHMYERTTFVGDDEPLQWENEQVALAVRRVSEPELEMEMPSLLEEIGGPRLELRLSLGYRTNWYAYENWRAPSFRGGKDGYPAAMLKDVVS